MLAFEIENFYLCDSCDFCVDDLSNGNRLLTTWRSLCQFIIRDVLPSLAFIYFHRNFKMAFATEENLSLIEEIQQYDCLYNKNSRDFKNKSKKLPKEVKTNRHQGYIIPT